MKKRKIRKIWIFLLFILLGIASSFYLIESKILTKEQPKIEIKQPEVKEEKPAEPENKRKEYKLSLVMVGDALYHTGTYQDGLKKDGSYNFEHQLTDIAPIVAKHDLAYYNQETILGGTELGLKSYPRFNSPQEIGDAFVKAGFNLVSLANNHTLDSGEKAILNSVSYWRNKVGVQTAGSYDSTEDKAKSHIGEKNGITYAFLAYTYGTNGLPVPKGKEYLVNVFDKEKAKKDIEAVRDKVDVVLVSMHWGVEYTHTPTNEQKDQAKFLSDLGVDVIIGSHPHVIQPIEHIGKTVVIYSLGNFISGQGDLMKRIGIISSLEINKVEEEGNTTVTINNVKGDLHYTYHQPGHKNYRVIPFYKLTNQELGDDVKTVKAKYEAIINKNDPTIQVGTLGINEAT